MNPVEIDAMLREYRAQIGRCGHIDAEILRLFIESRAWESVR